MAALSVPAQLIELEPDIVAMKDGELLIGEVKSRNSQELNDLNELADAVAQLPNTGLEVYWLGDEPGSEPSREVIREYVEEARVLLRTGHNAAAAVIAWAALEGALERYVSDTQVPIAANSEPVKVAVRVQDRGQLSGCTALPGRPLGLADPRAAHQVTSLPAALNQPAASSALRASSAVRCP